MKTWSFVFLLAARGLMAQSVTSQFTAKLTDSGNDPPLMAVVADAQEPADRLLTPALQVSVPSVVASRIVGFVNPAVAIPFNSRIRQVEAFWNGTPLPLIDPSGTGLAEEAHSYGPMIPFFKPMFSVASIPAGSGTLEVRGFDASHTQLAAVSIPGLSIVKPPSPVTTEAIAAAPHPRIYLTAARLAAMRNRGAADPAAQRYGAAVQSFLNALAQFPDVTSPQFEDRIYDPESYISLLALTYQLRKLSDPTTASQCAAAAHTLTMRIANDYDSGKRDFGRDTGYDIRFGLRDLMLAYDWMYDQLSASERALIVKTATRWIDWYHTTPGYAESWPVENYYAGYLQGIALTSVALAGDSADAGRFLTLLRTKLGNEVPLMNQRLAGGDWAEGGNYGPYSTLELSLVNTLLLDLGEDWSADFDWLQSLPRSLTYQVSPDFSETRSFGGYSGNYAHRTSPSTLAVLATTTRDGAFANRLYTLMNANPENDFADVSSDTFYEMIFASPAGVPIADAASLPLSYLNAGTGRFFSRSSLTDTNAWFVSAENTSYSYDHYGYANGDVRLYHGNACLVCPSAYRGDDFDGEAETPAFSTYRVNGADQPITLGRNNQILFSIEESRYSAVGMRFESSYVTSRFDESIVDPADPLDYLIREIVHLRPGTLVVRDLHRRRHASDTISARWHIGVPDAVRTSGVGSYRAGLLNVTTVYPPGVTVSFTDDEDGGGNRIGTLMLLDFASSTAPVELVTVFSETLTAASYTNSVLTLSDGTRVEFANGTVSVQGGGNSRRRAARK